MDRLISDLKERAERAGVAVSLFDAEDRLIACSGSLSRIYPFVDFGRDLTYDNVFWKIIERQAFGNPAIYEDPHRWLDTAKSFRQLPCGQTFNKLSDGRVIRIVHERIPGTPGWSYSVRLHPGSRWERLDGKQQIVSCSNNGMLPADTAAFLDLLEMMPASAALITVDGFLIGGNEGFFAELEASEVLLQSQGRLIARNASGQARFREFVSRAAERSREAPEILQLGGGHSKAALLTGHCLSSPSSGLLMLTFVNLARLPTLKPVVLSRLFGLTAAEASVAVLLGKGLTVEEIAARNEVLKSTVYSQVKTIIAKTGMRGQADIARCVVALAGLFPNSTEGEHAGRR